MCHRRIDVVPRPVIRATVKANPVIIADENDVALAVATKYQPFVARTLIADGLAAYNDRLSDFSGKKNRSRSS
jgi:hypothetical protein